MASDMTFVKGTKFFFSVDNITYTELVDIVDLGTLSSGKRPKVDKTPIDPATEDREYDLGLRDSGEHDFKQLWNSARNVVLQAQSGVLNYWRVVYPDATLLANRSKDEYRGKLSEFNKEAMSGADVRLVLAGKITITGPVTFTPKA